MRRLADAATTLLVRFLLAVFFRRVEAVGVERVPRERPLLLVANHVNGLVDPMLLWGPLALTPRLLAKSTLWKIPPLRPFLALAGVIPVYRRQDPGVDPAKNRETFAAARAELARGGSIALFPEGTSHSDPGRKPLKSGVARIVLSAEAEHGPLGVRVLPVGLHYEEKGKFRSRALVQVGDAIDPAEEAAAYREAVAAPGEEGSPEARGAVEALMARVERGLDDVTLSYPSWDEARWIALAVDLFDHPARDVPRGRRLARAVELRRAFLEGYAAAREHHPQETLAVEEATARYHRALTTFGLSDAQVASRYPAHLVLRFVGRTLVTLLLRLPVAAVGIVLNFVPYQLVRAIARFVDHLPDQQATYKVIPALFLYPLAWAAEAATVAWGLASIGGGPPSWRVGAAVFVLAPLAGWIGLRFHEERKRFLEEARAYLVLRTDPSLAESLRELRREAYERLSGLVRKVTEPAGDAGTRSARSAGAAEE